MNILIVTGSFPPLMCGVGDYTMGLALSLSNEPNVKVSVLTSKSVGHVEPTGKLVVRPCVRSWSLSEAFRVFSMIRKEAPDVVHIQYPTQGYAGRLPNLIPLLSKLAGAAVVQTWHEPMRVRDLLLRRLVPSEILVVRANFRSLLPPLARLILRRKNLHYISGASSLPIASLSATESQALRHRYLRGQRRLVVFFGFIYAHKGVDQLFDIADPNTDHIVIAGNFGQEHEYRARLLDRAEGRWAGRVTFTGFLSPKDAADLLSISDAVVLPFRKGGGDWNSSIRGATANGAYVITTSADRTDYDAVHNVAYAKVDDIDGMRCALDLSDVRRGAGVKDESVGWATVATSHMEIYRGQRPKAGTDKDGHLTST